MTSLRGLFETVARRADGEEIMDSCARALDRRWFEVESEQWQEPVRDRPAGAKYHGFR